MRLWHIALLPYLPDAQFKGQLRELVAIMHDWRDRGKTNHLLVNKVMTYPKEELVLYFIKYSHEWHKRYQKDISEKIYREFFVFAEAKNFTASVYSTWHNEKYLRVCMANLFEKYFFGVGASRITRQQWERLAEGYKRITGQEYRL